MKSRGPENNSSTEEEERKQQPDKSKEKQDAERKQPKTTQLPDFNQLLVDAANAKKENEEKEDEQNRPAMKEKCARRYTMVPTTEYLAEITRETVIAERRLRELKARKKKLEETRKKRIVIPLEELRKYSSQNEDGEQEDEQKDSEKEDAENNE
jgi:hypothetical protein